MRLKFTFENINRVTVSRLPPAACWRLQAAPGEYTRQML